MGLLAGRQDRFSDVDVFGVVDFSPTECSCYMYEQFSQSCHTRILINKTLVLLAINNLGTPGRYTHRLAPTAKYRFSHVNRGARRVYSSPKYWINLSGKVFIL